MTFLDLLLNMDPEYGGYPQTSQMENLFGKIMTHDSHDGPTFRRALLVLEIRLQVYE